MKILIVTQCFHPDVYACNDIARILVERGHEVTVLTGLPDYTTSRVPKEYKWFRKRREDYHGAKVYRVSIIARHHGAIFRCLNYLSFVATSLWFTFFHKLDDFDVVYVWQVSPVTMTIPAIRLAKRQHKPLYLYCLDLWPESVKAMSFTEGSLLFKVVDRLSRWIYSRCDHISVTSPSFIDYFRDYLGYPEERLSYIPQFASEDFLKVNLDKQTNGHFDFLFIGNIGKVQDVEVIIQAFSKLAGRNDWTMHIVGNGSNHVSCVALAKSLGLEDRVIFYGSCPLKETMKFYRLADACILTLKGDNLIGSTLPGKLQTYMAAGKPIIGAINGSGQLVIKQSQSGLCVAAGDVDGLSDALSEFMDNNSKYSQCGQNARRYFLENFTQEKFFSSLEKELEALIQGRL